MTLIMRYNQKVSLPFEASHELYGAMTTLMMS